jgi:hypothetical protein
VASLARGSIVYELRRVGTWTEVRDARQRLGWLEAAVVSRNDQTAAPAAKNPSGTLAMLSGAAIAALIVEQSRSAYYATGHPCACPDDLTRSGRRCGAMSAYSRPGGASPKCYPGDVGPGEIEEYRNRN